MHWDTSQWSYLNVITKSIFLLQVFLHIKSYFYSFALSSHFLKWSLTCIHLRHHLTILYICIFWHTKILSPCIIINLSFYHISEILFFILFRIHSYRYLITDCYLIYFNTKEYSMKLLSYLFYHIFFYILNIFPQLY